MKIACLGWGSLVWDPRTLPITGGWFQDGPLLPIEFTRCSSNRRITLVLDPKSRWLRVLWALMLPSDLDTATEALRERETVADVPMHRSVPGNRPCPFARRHNCVFVNEWTYQNSPPAFTPKN